MQFHMGAIPETGFVPDNSWRPLREPGPRVMQLCAFPFGIVAGYAVFKGWQFVLDGLPAPFFRDHPLAVMLALSLAFPVLIVVHEMIHAWVHPHFGRTAESVVGVWPSRLVFYAAFTGAHSRDRFIAILGAPFLCITLLPLAVGALCGHQLPAAVLYLAAYVSVLNALCACGDLFAIAMLFAQVPRTAETRNQGWRTYWRLPQTDSH